MVQGIDTAASGMVSVLALNDILANNLANINTPGFKQSIATFKNFQDVLVNQMDASKDNQKNSEEPGSISTGNTLDSTTLDFKQGGIKATGNPLDLAINGDGFFVVETPDGEAYTRNGNFVRSQDGTITTIDGFALAGENGSISLDLKNAGMKDLKIDSQGNIELKGQQIGKIKIVDFQDRNVLEPIGNSLLKPSNGQAGSPIDAANFELNQGTLESANSNVVECMVNSITGMRTYETLGKIIESANRTLGKSVNEVGRIKR